MTTSHLTNPAKDAGQVIGYSHSIKRANNARQVAGYGRAPVGARFIGRLTLNNLPMNRAPTMNARPNGLSGLNPNSSLARNPFAVMLRPSIPQGERLGSNRKYVS